MANKMKLERALEVFEYNKAMLTCDMSIGRDPEHQDVSPDYYGEDAENLYYAIVCVEEYIKKAIPIEFIEEQIEITTDINSDELDILYAGNLSYLLKLWEIKNGK